MYNEVSNSLKFSWRHDSDFSVRNVYYLFTWMKTVETGLPKVAPSFCSQMNPLYWKYVDLNTKVKGSAICADISVVRSARQGSFSIFWGAACTAASIGTLVNSDSTSKDTMISLSRIVSLLTVDRKRAELVTVYSEFPVKGDKMLAK